MNALGTNIGKKPHTHVRVKLAHSNGKVLEENVAVSKLVPTAALEKVKNECVWQRYAQSYSFDKDGATEYYILNGLTDDNFRLTAHVFSCYCEPLNENQEPPF